MIERFQGEGNARVRIDALRQQQSVESEDVARALEPVLSLRECAAEEVIIGESDHSNSMFFILSGAVSIRVKGREIAIRSSGQHVGEMALADPGAKRSATVAAVEAATVVAEVREEDFVRIAAVHPSLWRRLCIELASRLRERSKYVRPPNPRPVVFVGSSVESLVFAREIQNALDHDQIIVKAWTDNVFVAGEYTMDDLAREVEHCDFAVLVLGPDDEVISRGTEHKAPRDNVVLELGLFMGALGRDRTFVVTPRGAKLKIPTDLLGLKLIDYATADDPRDTRAAMGPACNQLRDLIQERGPR